MVIRVRRSSGVPSSEITPESAYLDRRRFLGATAGIGAATFLGRGVAAEETPTHGEEEPNSWEEITTHNNFYEFGLGKEDPSRNAHTLVTKPWTVRVDGLCAKPGDYALEDFIRPSALEDRVYRLRCVEGWSMVIPWRGLSLSPT